MAKLDWEHVDGDEIEPQHVTYNDLSAKHVHWDRVTLATLALGAVAFGVWGHLRSQEPARSTNGADIDGAETTEFHQQYPQTVALAALPLTAQASSAVRSSLSFFEPAPDTVVGPTLTVRGMVAGVPEGRHLWLITRREGQLGFWPKERIVPDAEGRFEQRTWDYGPDGYLSICVLSTTAQDTLRFDDWLAVGDREDVWPPLQSSTPRSTVLGCHEVHLDKRMNP